MSLPLPMAYFDALYRANPDPWDYRHRWYEARKRNLTLAILPRARFQHAYEPGCSTGELSRRLAERCDQLTASDGNASAVASARTALADAPHAQVHLLQLPEQWPEGRFDLIVISEIGYYLGAEGLASLLAQARAALTDDGVLLACHWRHPIEGCALTGDDVQRHLQAWSGLHRLSHLEETDFLLRTCLRSSE